MSSVVEKLTFQRQTLPYSLAGCGTLLAYDYFCTLDREVKTIWSSPFSWGKVLFLLNRYLPFIDAFLALTVQVDSHAPETCRRYVHIMTWLILFGTMVSETILAIRTYALWNQRRAILIVLLILAAFTYIPSIVVTKLEMDSLVYAHDRQFHQICALVKASVIIFIAYVLLVISETVIFILTAIKAFQHLPRTRSRWVYGLYRDGLLFYFYLLCLSLSNVLLGVAAPVMYANWLATPMRVIHSILCNRVMFTILEAGNAPYLGTSGATTASSNIILTTLHAESPLSFYTTSAISHIPEDLHHIDESSDTIFMQDLEPNTTNRAKR